MLGQKPVADTNVALRRAPDDDVLSFVFIVVDLTCRGTAKDLELEFALTVVIVDVKALLDVDLLLLLLPVRRLNVLLNVSVHAE